MQKCRNYKYFFRSGHHTQPHTSTEDARLEPCPQSRTPAPQRPEQLAVFVASKPVYKCTYHFPPFIQNTSISIYTWPYMTFPLKASRVKWLVLFDLERSGSEASLTRQRMKFDYSSVSYMLRVLIGFCCKSSTELAIIF